MKSIKILVFFVFATNTTLAETQDWDTSNFLKKFNQSPAEVMNLAPTRQEFGSRDKPKLSGCARWGAIAAQSDCDGLFREKIRTRRKLLYPNLQDLNLEDSLSILAEVDYRNDVNNFLGGLPKNTRLETMEAASLKEAKVAVQPWSDDYWALYSGNAARRYADPNFPKDYDFMTNYNYSIRANPYVSIIESGDAKAIDLLSPAEKYDSLTPLKISSLADALWDDAKDYYDAKGEVETWMGICHGWAPASFMLDRPLHSVKIPTSDSGVEIKFYPADIKAMATLLWANAAPSVRFVGGRCNKKDPERDSNGRITDPECFDSNPATWHLAIVDRIGVQKKSFVMDATYDYEVWNQPVTQYAYEYFNPMTNESVQSLDAAKVKIADFENDRFKKYRSPDAASVVGIGMFVRYLAETDPSQRETDSPDNDYSVGVKYYYDLELDESGEIIGGEWYTNFHPDFLWVPLENGRAMAIGDLMMGGGNGSWDGKSALPVTYGEYINMSSPQMQPLGDIVEKLIQKSRE